MLQRIGEEVPVQSPDIPTHQVLATRPLTITRVPPKVPSETELQTFLDELRRLFT
ncbi:MAG: hypothetical protein RMJ06_03830 [Nitrososphaerota archaeon]|nr:hypothetical protein [Nitrososphaerota archaeon]